MTDLSVDLSVSWSLLKVSDPPLLYFKVPAGKQHLHIRTGPSTGLKGRTTLINDDVEIENDTMFTFAVQLLETDVQVVEMQVFNHANRSYYRNRIFFEPYMIPHSGQWLNDRLRPKTETFVPAGGTLYWQTGLSSEPWKLYYCPVDFLPALPPHSFEEHTATWREQCSEIKTFSENPQEFQFRSPGVYRAKSVYDEEVWMFVSDDPAFPKLTTPASLIEATRYIARDDEFQALQNAPNLKEALDAFWLEKGDIPDRARTLIAHYYGRAEKANQLFTDVKPGWMTDRGMAYMVFGPPELAFYEHRKIVWEYPKFRDLKLEFMFENNTWKLVRSREHQLGWNMAVHAWRQGRVP